MHWLQISRAVGTQQLLTPRCACKYNCLILLTGLGLPSRPVRAKTLTGASTRLPTWLRLGSKLSPHCSSSDVASGVLQDYKQSKYTSFRKTHPRTVQCTIIRESTKLPFSSTNGFGNCYSNIILYEFPIHKQAALRLLAELTISLLLVSSEHTRISSQFS